MTYSVEDFCDLLISAWPTLPKKTQELIQRDLTEAFQRDDEARSDKQCSTVYHALGNDCDRQQWERVRALWLTLGNTQKN